MASINNSRHLFFTTSPRSPEKMIPEIEFLARNFQGEAWNPVTQAQFIQRLYQESEYYQGGGGFTDPAFSARDRINRAPQLLGFVNLYPSIKLTDAGSKLVAAKRTDEVFLRQLLKFQLPSPYHTVSDVSDSIFWVRPYLEIIRLIYDFGSLSFDELMFFGLQLTDYRKYEDIKSKIKDFRIRKATMAGNYLELKRETRKQVVREIFAIEIASGALRTRESVSDDIDDFVDTKAATMRDYTDACFRYIRSTGLFNIASKSRSLSIMSDRMDDVAYILEHTDRDPVHVTQKQEYQNYLFDSASPTILTDDRSQLLGKLELAGIETESLEEAGVEDLKDLLYARLESDKAAAIKNQVAKIKDYSEYSSIMDMFEDIANKKAFDAPLMLEWNTWRAMTMLDGGDIQANLKFDDHGQPMSTAQGNAPDIECSYEDYGLTVEVTMSSGQRQYEMEGEPVSRHLAKYKERTGKDAYCLFVAPTISEASISHFYVLHKTNISYYGGKSVIVPITLATFLKMLEDSYSASYVPSSDKVRELFSYSQAVADRATSETEWYDAITKKALNWLAV